MQLCRQLTKGISGGGVCVQVPPLSPYNRGTCAEMTQGRLYGPNGGSKGTA